MILRGYKKISAILKSNLLSNSSDSISVDLGCGSRPHNPLSAFNVIGIDISKPEWVDSEYQSALKFIQTEVGQKLPLSDNFADVVTGFDFLEHIQRTPIGNNGIGEFIRIMNEIHRVLKPGGIFIGATPFYPIAAAFTDPTHVNYITKGTHIYFTDSNWATKLGYGFTGKFTNLLVEPVAPGFPKKLWDEVFAIQEPKENFFKKNIRKLNGKTHLIWIFKKEIS